MFEMLAGGEVVVVAVQPSAAAVSNCGGAMVAVTWSGAVKSLLITAWLVMVPPELQL